MLGCSKANRHRISPYFRTSQLPNITTSRPPDASPSLQDSQFLFLLKRSAPQVQRSFNPTFQASAPHSFPASQLSSLIAFQPPSLLASQPSSLAAYSKILYFSLIAFSASAGINEISFSARIFLAISLARVQVSCEPFSIHFSRLSWSDNAIAAEIFLPHMRHGVR